MYSAKHRNINVYEAVAGRATHTRIDPVTSIPPWPPEEILLRQKYAPDRYEEDDFYWANQNLPPGIELPDSDLLKALHAYAAGFYGRRGEEMDFFSLDETALIAFAVLLEEWVEVVMGQKGHEVFLEGRKIRGTDHGGADRMKGKKKDDADVKKVTEEAHWGRRLRKRRKLKSDTEEGHTDG